MCKGGLVLIVNFKVSPSGGDLEGAGILMMVMTVRPMRMAMR